jgi:carbamoylphosphate synthase large subunit
MRDSASSFNTSLGGVMAKKDMKEEAMKKAPKFAEKKEEHKKKKKK